MGRSRKLKFRYAYAFYYASCVPICVAYKYKYFSSETANSLFGKCSFKEIIIIFFWLKFSQNKEFQ